MAFSSRLPEMIRNIRNAPAAFWAAALVLLAVMISYTPNLVYLVTIWWKEPNYSHGFLVAPIAAAILWQRRDTLAAVPIRPSLAGWVAVLAVLGARFYFYDVNQVWLENATLVLAVAALTLAMGGWRLLWWAAPGLLFLVFLLPLPQSVNLALAGPLQSLATVASSAILVATGLPVVTQGNVIHLGEQPLEVARACNGLSILMSFVTLVTATVILVRDFPLWQRVVLLLSTVPIALLSNVLRITATAWCYHLFGSKFGDKIAHDTAGWMMMPVALILVWIELKVMSWLVIEEQVHRRDSVRLVLQPAAGPRVVKK